jgi:membrane protein DedA with SNARE-associated domain
MDIVGLVQWGINLVLQLISSLGYAGVFFLMTLESALIPIPSEIIMPFSGFLVSTGRFGFWEVVLAGTLGNLFGSWIVYYLGARFGRSVFIRKEYRWLKKEHLILAESWFKKYGDKAIFISRMLPVVRTFISLPAGLAKMEVKRFLLYTFTGSVIWSILLTYIGYWLGKNWELVLRYTRFLEIAVIAAGLVLVWYWWRKR